jgi:RNA polymerase sigma-70 factor (ECF subfamily)
MTDSFDKEVFHETLQRAASGDENAWRVIVDAYSKRVFGLIRAQCGSVDLAEEITQSTFCTIVTKIESYTEQGKFEAWLFRIAMNRLRDEMRRRKRQATPMEDETLTGLAGLTEEDADRGDEIEARRGSLDRALSQLSPADRRIIHLRHFAELSFKQIAELLEQPLGTVLARQHRALKKLRDLMTDETPPS